jgi:hypothetical protein
LRPDGILAVQEMVDLAGFYIYSDVDDKIIMK